MKDFVSYLASNLKIMRNRANFTQEEISVALTITRGKWASYEGGFAKNLPVEDLMALSEYFKLSIDTLIKVDLTALSDKKLNELLAGNDTFITGSKLRVLHATLDNKGRENIELVPIKAKAGYAAGYNDPEFIHNLPTFQLPFLSSNKKYRTFQIDGDSMNPIPNKTYITAEYVDNWYDIKDGFAYIIITKTDGVVFKVVYNFMNERKTLQLHSYNPAFNDYEVKVEDIMEVWKFVNYIANELPDERFSKQTFMEELHEMEKRINHMKSKLM
jgi:transcriptional regulator with XRE-family HTH domain